MFWVFSQTEQTFKIKIMETKIREQKRGEK